MCFVRSTISFVRNKRCVNIFVKVYLIFKHIRTQNQTAYPKRILNGKIYEIKMVELALYGKWDIIFVIYEASAAVNYVGLFLPC